MSAPSASPVAVIIGAGPAGLTAAFELLASGSGVRPVVLEATERIGGLSCTIDYKGNRIDLGGHRFFSRSEVVTSWWSARLPSQGAPARDDLALGRRPPLAPGGPDPEQEDRVMLARDRISRILHAGRLFDYPLALRPATVLRLGLWRAVQVGLGYLWSRAAPRHPEVSLEDFVINRFGAPLYRMFFEGYTEKVWGVHPRGISAAWGAQRIRGLSLLGALRHALRAAAGRGEAAGVETSLIGRFHYPKLGPGQLWEVVAEDVRRMGGEVRLGHRVVELRTEGDRVVAVVAEGPAGRVELPCDHCVSSMPLSALVPAMAGAAPPPEAREIAAGLPYRDFMTVGVLLRRLRLRNDTARRTVGDIAPDNWIYVQEPGVRLCRLQIFNNWSPYLVRDLEGTVWLGLEYMCAEGDAAWRQDDATFIAQAIEELERLGIIDRDDVLDACRVRVEKAYPAYFGSYGRLPALRAWLDGFANLYCVGRNGQHRYNNQDHSMLTAMEAVRCIVTGDRARAPLWSVNTEPQHHEGRGGE